MSDRRMCCVIKHSPSKARWESAWQQVIGDRVEFQNSLPITVEIPENLSNEDVKPLHVSFKREKRQLSLDATRYGFCNIDLKEVILKNSFEISMNLSECKVKSVFECKIEFPGDQMLPWLLEGETIGRVSGRRNSVPVSESNSVIESPSVSFPNSAPIVKQSILGMEFTDDEIWESLPDCLKSYYPKGCREFQQLMKDANGLLDQISRSGCKG